MFQEITLIGNLGGDVELRYLPNGDPVANFSLATNRKWTGQDGQPGEETTWFRISCFGRLAENCNQYLSKGKQVFIKGRLTQDRETGGPRVWQDNNGNSRASFEVRAMVVQFLGGGSGERREDDSSSYDASAVLEDEVPF